MYSIFIDPRDPNNRGLEAWIKKRRPGVVVKSSDDPFGERDGDFCTSLLVRYPPARA